MTRLYPQDYIISSDPDTELENVLSVQGDELILGKVKQPDLKPLLKSLEDKLEEFNKYNKRYSWKYYFNNTWRTDPVNISFIRDNITLSDFHLKLNDIAFYNRSDKYFDICINSDGVQPSIGPYSNWILPNPVNRKQMTELIWEDTRIRIVYSPNNKDTSNNLYIHSYGFDEMKISDL